MPMFDCIFKFLRFTHSLGSVVCCQSCQALVYESVAWCFDLVPVSLSGSLLLSHDLDLSALFCLPVHISCPLPD